MQVERGLFQIAMAEQQLDGAQVGARLQADELRSSGDYAACGIGGTIPPSRLCRLKQSEVTEAPPGCAVWCGRREKDAA